MQNQKLHNKAQQLKSDDSSNCHPCTVDCDWLLSSIKAYGEAITFVLFNLCDFNCCNTTLTK